ncbi:hypothetical protein Dimus_017618 [Dionaea muscipula]
MHITELHASPYLRKQSSRYAELPPSPIMEDAEHESNSGRPSSGSVGFFFNAGQQAELHSPPFVFELMYIAGLVLKYEQDNAGIFPPKLNINIGGYERRLARAPLGVPLTTSSYMG